MSLPPRSTLSPSQVLEVRAMLGERDGNGRPLWSASSLARRFTELGQPISAETIRRIARGDTWGWLKGGEPTPPPVPPLTPKLEESVRLLQELLGKDEGKKEPSADLTEAAQEYGIPPRREG